MRFDQDIFTEDLPEVDNTAVPAGWYQGSIEQAEIKNTKAGTGQYLKLQWNIEAPSHEGRKIFQNINFRNHNEIAETIGLKQLRKLLTAIGVIRLEDTDQLIGKSCKIKVKKTESDEYGEGNDINNFKSNGGAIPAASSSSFPSMTEQSSEKSPAPQKQESATGSNPKPWEIPAKDETPQNFDCDDDIAF